ncbi:ROK family protein [Clostridium thermobutyricum]|uniref:ROK family protein n=1 Tax=Clostridium thermobutyricum TaxID=29372 RepID=UPI002942C10F|nr:ROK family protein [Clostridium thermobutyricum]
MNILSIDIGGTELKFGVIDTNGNIITKFKKETVNSGDYIIKTIENVFNEYDEKYKLKGIAISAPGFIDSYTGYMKTGGAIKDFYNFNLKKVLEEKLNINVEIENDANCVLLAEKWLGNGIECKNFLVMTIGTGIGGGMYINDKLYTGANFMAGEFGFMINNGILNNIPDDCIMSMNSSTSSLRNYYAKRTNKKIEEVSGKYVFEQMDKGDFIAKQEIDRFYNGLAIGLHNLFFTLNPEKILIGGGISVRDDIIQELSKRLIALSFMGESFKLEKCKFYNDSGIIGAVKNYIDKMNERKFIVV